MSETRATGKTYRKVLRAVADMSDGKHVVFVNRWPDRAYVDSIIYAVVQPLHNCAYRSVSQRSWELRRDDGHTVIGSVRITSWDEFCRGVREGRYQSLDPRKLEFVFDDCDPAEDSCVAEFLLCLEVRRG